jgi:hypothetical protein
VEQVTRDPAAAAASSKPDAEKKPAKTGYAPTDAWKK